MLDGRIFGHSDHARIGVALGEMDDLANWIPARPVFLRHGLADQHVQGTVAVIGGGKTASVDDPCARHGKKARAHRVEFDHDGIVHLGMTGQQDADSDAILRRHHGRTDTVCNAMHARQCAQVGHNRLAHGVFGILREGNEHLIAREADGLCAGIQETAHQRTGRDQQSKRNTNLEPDSKAAQRGSAARKPSGLSSLQRGYQLRAGDLCEWNQSQQKHGDKRQQSGKKENTPIQLERFARAVGREHCGF